MERKGRGRNGERKERRKLREKVKKEWRVKGEERLERERSRRNGERKEKKERR